MNITKDSRIVEVFSADLNKKTVDKQELKDANEYIKELASNPNPNNTYEMAQIMSYVINDGVQQRINYLDQIADVKRTGLNEKAQFEIDIDDLKAVFQAKSATTERSKVSSKYFTLETDEVSIRPVVDFLKLKTGQVNLKELMDKAVKQIDVAIAKRVQAVSFAAFSAMSSPNYADGAGISTSVFEPILNSMMRVGDGRASIIADFEALQKFTALTGYGADVPDQYKVSANENGWIGTYKGANLVKLNNPYAANSLTETELRKDLIYVMPSGDEKLRPVKVHLEGELQSIGAPVNINSKEVEFRFDQYVGVGAIGVRKLMGVYRDTTL